MQKLFAILGLITTVSGAIGPLVTSLSPKTGAIIAATGITAQAVTKPILDVAALWRAILGKPEPKQ